MKKVNKPDLNNFHDKKSLIEDGLTEKAF